MKKKLGYPTYKKYIQVFVHEKYWDLGRQVGLPVSSVPKNIRYILLAWLMYLSSWKFLSKFQSRLPRNAFFFLQNISSKTVNIYIYKYYFFISSSLSIFHRNLRKNLLVILFINKKFISTRKIKNKSRMYLHFINYVKYIQIKKTVKTWYGTI